MLNKYGNIRNDHLFLQTLKNTSLLFMDHLCTDASSFQSKTCNIIKETKEAFVCESVQKGGKKKELQLKSV